jgi:hypothetical protein
MESTAWLAAALIGAATVALAQNEGPTEADVLEEIRAYQCADEQDGEPYIEIALVDPSGEATSVALTEAGDGEMPAELDEMVGMRVSIGVVSIDGAYHVAFGRQDGLDYRIDFSQSPNPDDPKFAFVIRNSGSTAFFDFREGDTAVANRDLHCEPVGADELTQITDVGGSEP